MRTSLLNKESIKIYKNSLMIINKDTVIIIELNDFKIV